jgi:hypothetical protein
MRGNRWRIDRISEEDETLTGPSAPVIEATSARARLRAVPGGSG